MPWRPFLCARVEQHFCCSPCLNLKKFQWICISYVEKVKINRAWKRNRGKYFPATSRLKKVCSTLSFETLPQPLTSCIFGDLCSETGRENKKTRNFCEGISRHCVHLRDYFCRIERIAVFDFAINILAILLFSFHLV